LGEGQGHCGSPEETNNVSLGSEGAYSVLVSDDVTTIQSQEARLIVKVAPIILIPPIGQTNRVGADATYTVRVSGSVPMTYFWRRTSFGIATNILFSTNDSLTLTNLQLSQSAFYRLVVTNAVQTNFANGPWSAAFAVTTLADNDRDGLPDNYEVAYGLNTNDVSDAIGDLDGDGMRNLDEYRAGTDPANPASYLRVDVSTSSGQATVVVSAVSNRTYSVQYSDALNSGQWRKLGDIFARVTNRIEVFTDPSSNTNRFYRVVLPQQP